MEEQARDLIVLKNPNAVGNAVRNAVSPLTALHESSSPPKSKGAGILPEKTLNKAGGRPSGELDKSTKAEELDKFTKHQARQA